MNTSALFEPCRLGPLALPNRVVMAPLTRCRSPESVPTELVATYYAQRAEAGLIVSEGTSPSPNGLGYPRMPGLFEQRHVTAWRRVTEAVHAQGGRIFVQLMHAGRVGLLQNLPGGARLLGPSAVVAPSKLKTDAGALMEAPTPEAMSEADIHAAIAEFERAAGLAIDAGFDGVELHGANGYLIDQFLNVASNLRTDRWGGDIAGRTRFALEIARRVAANIGGERVGMRVSPYGAANGMRPDSEHEALYGELAFGLAKLGLVYMHIVDHSAHGAPPVPASVKETIRTRFGGPIILVGGYDKDRARAEADLTAGRAQLIAYGRAFISNPRLVTKLRTGAALLPADPKTFYSAGPEGYTDYPL